MKRSIGVMHFKFVLLVLLLGCARFVCGQKEASNWFFDQEGGMKFDSTGMHPLNSSGGKVYGPTSSISDENCSLLFYTDGGFVYDRHTKLMPNGFGLGGVYTAFRATPVIVPNPLNNGTYYIFCVNPQYVSPSILAYSVVDLSLNAGLGDVTTKRQILDDSVAGVGVLAAVMHANGKDIWVITHEWNTNRFQSWLVTSSGVSTTPVVSAIGAAHGDIYDNQMHVSPDGDKIVVTSGTADQSVKRLELFNFSVVTGKIYNQIFSVSKLTDPDKYKRLMGAEFSPDGKFLYATSDEGYSGKIYQFDLESGDQASILNSVVTVGKAVYASPYGMQLAPDGKIYISAMGYGTGGGSSVSRINYPKKKGVDSGYEEVIPEFINRFGGTRYLPIFVENYVTPPPSFDTSPLCVLNSTFFYPTSLGYYDSLVWDFGDPASGSLNKSRTKNAAHQFSSDGNYKVSLTMYFDGLVRRRVSKKIALNKMSPVELGSDTTICNGNKVTLSVIPGFTQLWSTGTATSSIDVTKSGLYKVTMTNGQCTVKDSIKVIVLDQPKVNFPDSLLNCTGSEILDSKNPTFNVLWSTGETTSAIRVRQTGKYHVKVTNGKCFASDTIFVRLANVSDLTALASKDSLGYNENVAFVANATDIVLWRWNFGDGVLSNDRSPLHLYQTEGAFSAVVTATNSLGCKDSVQVKVFVKPFLFIPNVFTPNGDGKNDAFVIEYNGDQNFDLSIYNRWGREVFHSNSKQNTWEGRSEDAGAFYYHLILGSERFKGWVQLIR